MNYIILILLVIPFNVSALSLPLRMMMQQQQQQIMRNQQARNDSIQNSRRQQEEEKQEKAKNCIIFINGMDFRISKTESFPQRIDLKTVKSYGKKVVNDYTYLELFYEDGTTQLSNDSIYSFRDKFNECKN